MEKRPLLPGSMLTRSWEAAEARIAKARADRHAATGSAVSPEALWATECELRASTGYARARALDLEHHIQWQRLIEQINGTTPH